MFEAPTKHADLSDEEASSLAEQVAEARQEEARAEADAAEHEHGILDEEDAHAPEGAAETEEFVAEAEAGESEDAAIIEATGEGMEEAVAEGGPGRSRRTDPTRCSPKPQPDERARLRAAIARASSGPCAAADGRSATAVARVIRITGISSSGGRN